MKSVATINPKSRSKNVYNVQFCVKNLLLLSILALSYIYIYTHTHTHMPSYLHNKSSTRLHAIKLRYEIVELDGTNLFIFLVRHNVVS